MLNDKFSAQWQALFNAKSNARPQAFTDYAKQMIAAEKSGELSLAEASYNICGAGIKFSELDDIPELEEAIAIACDLELPPPHRLNTSEVGSWKRLQQLIENYSIGDRGLVELRLKLDCAIENSQGQIIASFSGWAYRRQHLPIIRTGNSDLTRDLSMFAVSLPKNTDDKAWLSQIKHWLDQPSRIKSGHLTTKIVEYVNDQGQNAQHHSPVEMQHLQSLLDKLNDNQLAELVSAVGLKFEASEIPPDRDALESIITEVDSEKFYTEYSKVTDRDKT